MWPKSSQVHISYISILIWWSIKLCFILCVSTNWAFHHFCQVLNKFKNKNCSTTVLQYKIKLKLCALQTYLYVRVCTHSHLTYDWMDWTRCSNLKKKCVLNMVAVMQWIKRVQFQVITHLSTILGSTSRVICSKEVEEMRNEAHSLHEMTGIRQVYKRKALAQLQYIQYSRLLHELWATVKNG